MFAPLVKFPHLWPDPARKGRTHTGGEKLRDFALDSLTGGVFPPYPYKTAPGWRNWQTR